MVFYIVISIGLVFDVVAILRVLLRPHRQPASRIAWVATIILLPFVGALAYWLLGEVNIGRNRIIKIQKIQDNLPNFSNMLSQYSLEQPAIASQNFNHIFKLGKSISRFDPVANKTAKLLPDSEQMINSLVADIDTATDHVHLLFYIWQPDSSGLLVLAALKRAAKRGVKCRLMVDSIGSTELINSSHWAQLAQQGILAGEILPIGNLIRKIIRSRIDLRNHRKLVIIDDSITYCGSQNCANAAVEGEPDSLIWVDVMLRIEGPVARQNQYLFASDWMICTGEDISDLLHLPLQISADNPARLTAQVIGTGPTDRHSAMSQMFVALITSSRKNITITTPYFIPNAAIQSALQAAAYRGVKTTMIFPAKNDSWVLQCASHSYYEELLNAGVRIFEYTAGLLHAKTLTIDGEFAMIGSANLDRRSFDLNYENNLLIYDPELVAELTQTQNQYISSSDVIDKMSVAKWPASRKILYNAVAMLGPLL
ncbi:MAG: cardiolipin synthase [Rhizobiales bacterium]|nr:cardiolipin synthase [Hyphomicrobiales bacterium]NRB13305.1 cardiolipin synthase [Hyphomicrobiales bacterium]